MALVMIVEDEQLLRWTLSEQIKRAGHKVEAAGRLSEAKDLLGHHQPRVLLLDIALPDGNGLDFFEESREQLESTSVIVMTAVGQVDQAVRAMKLGAVDFLSKPVDQEDLVRLVEHSITRSDERLEAVAARQNRERTLGYHLIGESPAFLETLRVVETAAESEVETVLLQGESGCGKNVLARHIHACSSRRGKPLLEVSCAAIPDQLLESELLGHERGAFTDAKSMRRGAFELAEGGTVVLDEIGELKLELQAKLLHVLEERRLRRVGGEREIFIDVRVLALTNRNLPDLVREGLFRQDLFYRLSVFPVNVPPLRERSQDILPLARSFVETLRSKLGRKTLGFSREAENLLLSYTWPGNVRELRNVIERAMILTHEDDQLTEADLVLDQTFTAVAGSGVEPVRTEIVPLPELERQMIERAMEAAGQNKTRAAELLGITRDQLRYRLKK